MAESRAVLPAEHQDPRIPSRQHVSRVTVDPGSRPRSIETCRALQAYFLREPQGRADRAAGAHRRSRSAKRPWKTRTAATVRPPRINRAFLRNPERYSARTWCAPGGRSKAIKLGETMNVGVG